MTLGKNFEDLTVQRNNSQRIVSRSWPRSKSASVPLQYQAFKAVNKEPIGLYRDIGRLSVERQAGDTRRGKSILQ